MLALGRGAGKWAHQVRHDNHKNHPGVTRILQAGRAPPNAQQFRAAFNKAAGENRRSLTRAITSALPSYTSAASPEPHSGSRRYCAHPGGADLQLHAIIHTSATDARMMSRPWLAPHATTLGSRRIQPQSYPPEHSKRKQSETEPARRESAKNDRSVLNAIAPDPAPAHFQMQIARARMSHSPERVAAIVQHTQRQALWSLGISPRHSARASHAPRAPMPSNCTPRSMHQAAHYSIR